jgi:hypothetical protein
MAKDDDSKQDQGHPGSFCNKAQLGRSNGVKMQRHLWMQGYTSPKGNCRTDFNYPCYLIVRK